ncbi:hypothetical protein B0H13DRAFT_1595714 [Mycena leptocephala]|nr:hypothetical protein B0H13DRAFT_1595714 [Mycena leptocephala]
MVGGLSKELVDSLNGPGINQLGNVLTVNSEDHDSIGMLWLWLEKLEAPDNTYKICSGSESLVPRPNVVTFSTDTCFPLPRSDLLAVHAAACRVAHLSGAAEYLRMREEEDNEEVPAVWASETEFAAVLQKKLERVQRVLSVH